MGDRLQRLIPLLLTTALTGCVAATSPGESARPVRTGNAIVIGLDQLHGRGADLLRLIHSRVANMQVRRTGACPQITIRGAKSVHSVSMPSVYVDGQRAANTCILEMLNPQDVERVEVYPMGITSRPGYLANGAGLILVFMRRAAG